MKAVIEMLFFLEYGTVRLKTIEGLELINSKLNNRSAGPFGAINGIEGLQINQWVAKIIGCKGLSS